MSTVEGATPSVAEAAGPIPSSTAHPAESRTTEPSISVTAELRGTTLVGAFRLEESASYRLRGISEDPNPNALTSASFDGWILGTATAGTETFRRELSLEASYSVPLQTDVRLYLTRGGTLIAALNLSSDDDGSKPEGVATMPALLLSRHPTLESAASWLLGLRYRYGSAIASDAIVEAVGEAVCRVEDARLG